ncbi:hypothetical protein ARALYDRAFT_489532 [Arabidopsis lyrata subsp. lyrata]|uniref:Uncharacterized protein n=1 Tax=Arabidopsis lyrata subsp. lyrata TaxID=81972 RepID=D7M5F7_ARALL|nr:hypothetical protein ARALYDRAFT_489532 [Arabidopsis lyrata subsp. lyrata]
MTSIALALCLTHHSPMVLSIVDDDPQEKTMDSLWKKRHVSDLTRSGSLVGVTEAYLVIPVDHFLTNPSSLTLSPRAYCRRGSSYVVTEKVEERDDFLKQVWFLRESLVFFFVDIEESIVVTSASRKAYMKQLAETIYQNHTRILAFRNKPKALFPSNHSVFPHQQPKSVKPRRYIPQTREKILNAPGTVDDFYINLLDWGKKGPVTSLNWTQDGHLGFCFQSSTENIERLSPVKSWIIDMEQSHSNNWMRSSIVGTYVVHTQEVCGLKWERSGQQLASGGNVNVVHIWDCSVSSSNSTRQWLHSSCLVPIPSESACNCSGIHTGACLNSVETGSQVCSLLWRKSERQLLSSHGFTQNQLTLWKYPSMLKMAELTGHTSRVLYMAQSPDGCTVASAAGDETLRFWNVSGVPETTKKAAPEPFSHVNRIR